MRQAMLQYEPQISRANFRVAWAIKSKTKTIIALNLHSFCMYKSCSKGDFEGEDQEKNRHESLDSA